MARRNTGPVDRYRTCSRNRSLIHKIDTKIKKSLKSEKGQKLAYELSSRGSTPLQINR